MPVARRLDRRVYRPDHTWVHARRRPCQVGADAQAAERCLTQRAKGPPSGSGVGPGGCRGAAVRLRPCCHEDWDPGPEVWRRVRRLLLRRGEQAPAISGTKSSSCVLPVRRFQATSSPLAPVRQRVERRAPVTGKTDLPASRWASSRAAALCALAARPGSSNRMTIQKKPAGRSHAQREAAGHR